MPDAPSTRVQGSADFLNLPNLRTLEAHDNSDHYLVEANGQGEPTACPSCGHIGLYRHGKQPQRFMDTPMHGKRVLIEVQRRRYRCTACGKTLFSTLPDMDGKRFATSRLIRYLEERCLTQTFAELGRQVGVDERTVRHVFDDYVERMGQTIHFETPEILGIDELKIIGQYRAMITNVEKLALYDMLPTRKKADLIDYFKRLPDKHKVQVLTMDLWNVYRQVAEAQFPGRIIVADRWHVLRMANDAVEKTRKAVRKTLNTRTRLKLKDDRFLLLTRWDKLSAAQQDVLTGWARDFPALGAAYRTKEAFHDLYHYDTRNEAERAAEAWINSVPPELSDTFREVVHALRSWWTEIFNWYECQISNAYTESINRIAKDMNRMGRGYSFEVIRARLIFDEEARRPNRKTVRSKPRRSARSDDFSMGRMSYAMASETSTPDRVIEYGPHIPTLCDLLETGHFS